MNAKRYMEAERARIAAEIAAHEARYPETTELFDQVLAELHAEDPAADCPACEVASLTADDRAHLVANGWTPPRHQD